MGEEEEEDEGRKEASWQQRTACTRDDGVTGAARDMNYERREEVARMHQVDGSS